jgi:hypothetical protein
MLAIEETAHTVAVSNSLIAQSANLWHAAILSGQDGDFDCIVSTCTAMALSMGSGGCPFKCCILLY